MSWATENAEFRGQVALRSDCHSVLDLEEGTVQRGDGGSAEKGQRPGAFGRADDLSMSLERGAHRTNTLRNRSHVVGKCGEICRH